MKFIQTFFTLWGSFLLLSGCAPKVYEKNESRLIVLKTPKIKYADLGYIRSSGDEVRADLFVVGQLVQSIEISTLVCVNEGCLSKSAFKTDYLHPSYPDELIVNVLLGRPIFEKASLQKTPNGFIQELKSNEYNIIYKVQDGDISFKDTKNRLKIKILRVKG